MRLHLTLTHTHTFLLLLHISRRFKAKNISEIVPVALAGIH